MFKFLKDKLKKAVSIFSRKVEEEAEVKEEIRPVKSIIAEKPVEKTELKPQAEEESEEEKEQEEILLEERQEVLGEPFELRDEEGEQEEEKEPKEKKPLEELEKETEEIKDEIEQELEKIKEEEEEKEPEAEKKEPEAAVTEEEIDEELKEIKETFFEELGEKNHISKLPEKAAQPEKLKKTSFLSKLFGKKEEKEEQKGKKEDLIAEKEIKEAKPEAELEAKEAREEKDIRKKITEAEEAVKEKKPEAKAIIKEIKAEEAELGKELEEEQEKKGFFRKLTETFTTVKLSEEKFEGLFWELEVVLMENNVAVEVIDKIKADLKRDLTTGKVSRRGIDGLIEDSLRNSVEELFVGKRLDIAQEVKKKKEKPFVIAFIGVNGSGKTTTMAKIANMLLKNHLSVVFAASDTFRAAAMQQLQEHADKLGVKMIKHDYESDPAAVAFDAVKHAQAKGIDVVLIDTAGRLHSNDNLMNELKKLVRVNKPDMKIFVGESITGNDCVEQAKLFNEAVGIDAIILAKADVDEKGGAAVSVSYVTQKPIIYLGTGQKYEDLTEFKPELIIKNIGL
jgi:fused signal recognition particle receptor